MFSIPIKLNPTFYDYAKRFCAEFIATFIFLFAVFTVGINIANGGNLVVGVAVGGAVTAFAAIAVLVAFGDISGAHFNPAVTFGAWLGQRIGTWMAIVYVIAQLSASTAAAGLIYAVFPNVTGLVTQTTLRLGPATTYYCPAVAAEFIFTMIFLLVVYMVGLGMVEIPYLIRLRIPVETKEDYMEGKEEMFSPHVSSHLAVRKNYYAAGVIGLTLEFLSMLGGNLSRGAFNPARVFGPELITGAWGPIWIYWLGDLCGAAFGTGLYFLFFSDAIFYAKQEQISGPNELVDY